MSNAGYVGFRHEANNGAAPGMWTTKEKMLWNERWPTIAFIGGSVVNSLGTQNYPSGTLSGDLVIAVTHGGGTPAAPSGFTIVFNTALDPLSYGKNVAYKIAGVETSVIMSGSGGFDGTLLTFRRANTVSTNYDWKYAGWSSYPATATLTVPYPSGAVVVIASDRGGANYPTLNDTPDFTVTGITTYQYQKTGIYFGKQAGNTISYTDTADTYGTSGLLIVVN